ncbi:MAG: creatininase family protein [Firmicutes bacterium]|nr:creatininase family protein [Bacillota bacterium]
MNNKLSTNVQMQFLRPAQLEKRGRDFPVVYVPFGLIEWHGHHLPLGNDALKAHAILVKAAEMYGGTVYPPVWFHENFGKELMVPVLTQLFERLKQTGYRVIIGVSGHNVQEQIEMINEGLQPVVADGTVAGLGMWEVTLSQCKDSNTDHAAKWETSNMMFFYPETVDMTTIEGKDLTFDMEPPWGIGGHDPRIHASAGVGELNCRLCAESIGKKAKELLESLPPENRNFNMEKLEPGNWWFI